ncbi:hypothetical protein Q8W37_03890 [Shimia thalassica]|uniref:hypothetical protein n=1 Tax=Shimia thalassica TaxID=1715693 RepID=UPI0027350169|nr:hypothetical protein [Shimia thalassica]MDP2579060.1 hypothetical protein [Shimia thalassica]
MMVPKLVKKGGQPSEPETPGRSYQVGEAQKDTPKRDFRLVEKLLVFAVGVLTIVLFLEIFGVI